MSSLSGDRVRDTLFLHGGIGCLFNDGLRDLGVRVTALVQRASYECCDVSLRQLSPMSLLCLYIFWW
jgi:hypothetical protein